MKPVQKGVNLGDPIEDPIRIDFSHPIKKDYGWEAHITIIDVFGNLTTDLPAEFVLGSSNIQIRLGDYLIEGLVPSYGHRLEGEMVALIDSENYIEIGAVNGSAAQVTGAKIGDKVEVILNG